jgi:hypothetical protein
MGIVLIAAPWMLGFADNTAATWVPVLLGIGAIVYSLFTDYEMGAFRAISMRGHLWLDALSGIFLAASPWLFGFSDYVYTPHLVLGVVEVLAALCTRTVPGSVLVRDRVVGSRSVSRDTLGTRATPGLRSDVSGEQGTGSITPGSTGTSTTNSVHGSSINGTIIDPSIDRNDNDLDRPSGTGATL